MEHRSSKWREAPDPVSILLACDWLPADQAEYARSHLETTSSSHALSRVSDRDGRKVVVKRVPQRAASNMRSLQSEMFVYRLARWMPAVAAALPRPVFIDERRHVLVLESLSQGSDWPDHERRAALCELEVARQLAGLLADFHRATEHMQMWPSPAPGMLGLSDALDHATADRHAHTQALMSSIVRDPQLVAALRSGAAHYSGRCVIHGDLRVENWGYDETASARGLKIFDWELAGSGDPLWDLSSMLAASSLAYVLRDPPHSGMDLLDSIDSEAAAFLSSYFERWEDLLNEPNLRSRLVEYWIARLLHIACEHTDQGAEPATGTVHALSETAHQLAARHTYVVERVATWLPRS